MARSFTDYSSFQGKLVSYFSKFVSNHFEKPSRDLEFVLKHSVYKKSSVFLSFIAYDCRNEHWTFDCEGINWPLNQKLCFFFLILAPKSLVFKDIFLIKRSNCTVSSLTDAVYIASQSRLWHGTLISDYSSFQGELVSYFLNNVENHFETTSRYLEFFLKHSEYKN